MSQHNRGQKAPWQVAVLILALALVAIPALAGKVNEKGSSFDGLARTSLGALAHIPDSYYVQAAAAPQQSAGWEEFTREYGTEWHWVVDQRTGKPSLVEGRGIAWVPGKGNSMQISDLSAQMAGPAASPGIDTLERIAREFMDRNPNLFGVPQENLVLSPGRSGQLEHLWFVDFDYFVGGIRVEGARIVFRVNNGNLIQFGMEGIAPHIAIDTEARVDADAAAAAVDSYIGGFDPTRDRLVSAATLKLIVGSPEGDDPRIFMGSNGHGIAYALVWELSFTRQGEMGTWMAQVDAKTGDVLAFYDKNEYAAVKGGIYPKSQTASAEVVRALPYADVLQGTTGYANVGGIYTWGGSTASSTLKGQYVSVVDSCGSISLSTSASPGDLNFSSSTGTDCVTPGVGGAGNTHASRSSYYHLSLAKAKGRAWLPSNSWLSAKLTDNVNLNQTCNAYWNGSSVNFFRSGGGCGNTGEIAAIFLHEMGHGLDSNDGGSAGDNGTGETYGDTFAALASHESCIGPGFLGSNCGGYGDACTACTGVRDIDYAKHSSGVAHTIGVFVKNTCPNPSANNPNYKGPCGKEGHCESYPVSEAVWDLANRDLANPATATSWMITERLWFLSRSTTGSAYSCSNFVASGCGASNWVTAFRAADDEDGNLANGTPHAAAIHAAFNRHGVSCGTAVNTNSSTCPVIATPALTATPTASVALSWGAVTNAARYYVLRNEFSATAGFTRIADVTGTSYTDTAVLAGVQYHYSLQAIGSNAACYSSLATVQSVTPTTGGGDVTAPTVSITAPANGSTVSGGATAVNASASDAVGVSKVEFLLDGVLNSTDTASPYSWTWDTTTASNGGHALVAKAYDAANNIGTSATISVTVSNGGGGGSELITNGGFETGAISPWVASGTAAVKSGSSPYTPRTGTYYGGLVHGVNSGSGQFYQSIAIASNAATATLTYYQRITTAETTTTTQYDKMYVEVLNSSGTLLSTLQTLSNLNKNTVWTSGGSYSLLAWKGQTVRVQFRATSDSSLLTYFGVEDVSVQQTTGGTSDTTAPTSSITAPTNGATVSGTATAVNASASDAVGVTKVEFYLDGALKSTDTASPYSWTWNTTTSSNGSHALVAKAYDAANNIGTSATVTVTVSNSGGTSGQILVNPGFESGAVNWIQSVTGVVDNTATYPSRTGSWKAWLQGYGTATTSNTLYQDVALSSAATVATLDFYLRVDSAETTTTSVYDTLKVQVRNTAGTVLATLATYSNLNESASYSLKSFNLLPYKGQTIRVYFLGAEDSSLQTSFLVDDTALNVTQ